MGERRSLGCLARVPLYNTSAVVQMTGVPADTFRAWERRYGLPRPFRSASNQRLYSEQDTGVISWLRDRTDEGMTISQAIQRLKMEVPEVFVTEQPAATSGPDPEIAAQASRLQHRFLDTVSGFDTYGAESVVDDALARMSIEAFSTRLVEPVRLEIGQRRSDGQMSEAVEHFALRLLERRLASILTIAAPQSGRGTIVVSAFGDLHEVALLLLSIALARRGWRIVYLGSRIQPDALVDAARAIRPDVVCISASTAGGERQAGAVAQILSDAAEERVPVVVSRSVADGIDQVAGLNDLELLPL